MSKDLAKKKWTELSTMGERVRWARQIRGLTLEQVAEKIGPTTAGTISKIETGENFNPSVHLALSLAEVLQIEPRWMAFGEGSPNFEGLNPEEAKLVFSLLIRLLSDPEGKQEMKKTIRDWRETSLPLVKESVNFAPVTFADLKTRISLVATRRGKKAELAEFLGVSRAHLSQWLNSDRQPGADVAFRMLEWVQAEEEKQESPASAETPAEPQTRPAQRINEAQESSPPGGYPGDAPPSRRRTKRKMDT